MSISAPDWLKKHGGELRPVMSGNAWIVFFDGEPQHSLSPIPVSGRHSCRVMQTINGRQLDVGSSYPTEEDALRAGLEVLRQALGW